MRRALLAAAVRAPVLTQVATREQRRVLLLHDLDLPFLDQRPHNIRDGPPPHHTLLVAQATQPLGNANVSAGRGQQHLQRASPSVQAARTESSPAYSSTTGRRAPPLGPSSRLCPVPE